MVIYEAVALQASNSPLYDGTPRLMILQRDEHGALVGEPYARDLEEAVLSPEDPQVLEALGDMGYALASGPSGPCAIREDNGWRMLIVPAPG